MNSRRPGELTRANRLGRPRWKRALKPALISGLATAVVGVLIWPAILILGGTLVSENHGAYLGAAVGVAAGHALVGSLFRTSTMQGLWVGSDGSLRLCSPFGELVLASGTVDRILLDRGSGSAFVWGQGRVWWLETSARIPIVRPSDAALERVIASIRETTSCEVGFIEDPEVLRGQPVTSLEFSFRGFSRVIRSRGVWVSVLVGQLLLVTALA